ncbi:MAG TPA: GGDEF domain-containing protein [Pseudoxanthomonas sp.]|nr:GGDEF domain-containing protein [Pseudoxanthomonas sp.]
MNPEHAALALGPGPALSIVDGVQGGGQGVAVLSEQECALFARCGSVRSFPMGGEIFTRGVRGDSLFVVLEGEVDLDFGDDVQGKRLGPREFFGELGLLIDSHARSAAAIAASDCKLLELKGRDLQTLIDHEPATVSRFMHRAIVRVVSSEQDLIRRLRGRNAELQSALDDLRVTAHRLNQSEELNRTDELTSLANRRGLNAFLERMANADGLHGYGLMLIDCDRFKAVNDEYGHLIGDRVLQSVANILRSLPGENDFACRLGGDEFCLVMHAAPEELLRYANYIVSTAQSLRMTQHSPPLITTLSVGAYLVDPTGDWDDWYVCADAALYRAKRVGGNRVEWQD